MDRAEKPRGRTSCGCSATSPSSARSSAGPRASKPADAWAAPGLPGVDPPAHAFKIQQTSLIGCLNVSRRMFGQAANSKVSPISISKAF